MGAVWFVCYRYGSIAYCPYKEEVSQFQFDKGGDCMKLKHKIVIEILLVIAAIAVFIYNFSMQREIAYIASIVAVCGTIAFLIKDIVKCKKNK